jgi:oligopeptide/dipeptide ABC transporter ATP-binding protein
MMHGMSTPDGTPDSGTSGGRMAHTPPREELLRVDGLHVAFQTPDGPREMVRGVDLRIAPGEIAGIVGESGSGKSLTALAIMRLLPTRARVSSGRIMFRGQDLTELSDNAMNALRGAQIAMVFQDPLSALNPALTVGRQLTDAMRTHQGLTHSAAWSRGKALLDMVGIQQAEQRMRAWPHELSGGMRQRVMIALAVSNNPALLICDEPTTALDVTVQAQVMDLLDLIRREYGIAILFISHNLDLVAEVAERVTVMYAGKVVESGSVETLFEQPRHPYTRQLIRCIPRLDGQRGPMPTILGMPPRAGDLSPGCPFAPRCDVADERCSIETPPIWRETTHMATCWRIRH